MVFLRICSLFFWLLFVLFEIIYKIRILFLMTFQFFHLSNLVLILFIAISFLFLDLFYFIFSFHPLLYFYYFYFYIILDPYFFYFYLFFFYNWKFFFMIFMGLPSIMELGLMTRVIGFENWLDLSSICFFFSISSFDSRILGF